MSAKSANPIPVALNETVEATLSLTQTCLNASQNIVDLNFSTLRKILDDEASCLTGLTHAASAKEASSLQTTLAKNLAETAMGYAKEAWKLNLKNVEEIAEVLRSNQELLRQSAKTPWQGLNGLSGLDFFRSLTERK